MTAYHAASLKKAQHKMDAAWAAYTASPSFVTRAAMKSATHSLLMVQSAVWDGTEWMYRSHKPLKIHKAVQPL